LLTLLGKIIMGVHERRQREKESVRANILQAAFNLAKRKDGHHSP
jgi:hypothetical protein